MISDDEAEGLLNRIFPVSRETFETLRAYRSLLDTWQRKTNLVSSATLSQFWERHVADSLQVLALKPRTNQWIDLGSGAGFPGMVVAIAQRENSGGSHILIESNAKKCAFLRETARATATPATVVCDRIESASKHFAHATPRPEMVTARALSSLANLIELAEPLLLAGATGLFHKGREYARELEECRGLWQLDLVIHESRVAAGSVLLEVRDPVRIGAGR